MGRGGRKKARFLHKVATFMKLRMIDRATRETDEVDDDFKSAIDMFSCLRHYFYRSKQYIFLRSRYRKRSDEAFADNLECSDNEESGKQSFLSDDEFLQKYRMSRSSFHTLVELIEDHPVFEQGKRGPPQAPPAHQLMVLLKYLGTQGSGGSNPDLRNLFRLGRGSSDLYKQRAYDSILSLSDGYYTWPDEEEKKRISERIRRKYGIPNCVMIADGTLHELAFKPQTDDWADYHGRKYAFSISTLVLNDDRRRIHYFLAGWPGSAHDNRIFKNSSIYKNFEKCFSEIEYMIGDSAFEPTKFMVSAFKKIGVTAGKEIFNDTISRPRVISEHTIGIWKGRFPWLRSIRMRVTKDKQSMVNILTMIMVSVILHNFLIEENEPDWINNNLDDVSDIDAGDPQDDLLFSAVPANANNDLRRKQLLRHIMDRS